MFGDGGGSGYSNLVEVMEKQDVVSDRGLSEEHFLLFVNDGRQTVGRGGVPKDEEKLRYGSVICFSGGVVFKVFLPVV